MEPTRLRLVFCDAVTFGDVSLERFKANWDCAVHQVTRPEEVADRVRGYRVIVTNKVVINRALLESPATSGLRLIAEAATGTDNIDLEAARARGVWVCNVPGYAAR